MTTTAPPAVYDQKAVRRVVVASSIGTVVEWYDFSLYGAASALVFAPLFFPGLGTLAGTLSSFAVFGIAFFLRPFGGLIAAHLGDRIGRKPILIATVVLMGSATVIVGLLPTYETIGVWAPILLIATRMLQGLGAGAEFSGAVTTVSEYVPERRRAFYTSWSQASVGIAIATSTGIFALLSLIPHEVLLAWAWRVPFLFSIVIFGVAIFIRRRIEETPLFQQTKGRIEANAIKPERVPLFTAFREAPRQLVVGTLMGSGLNVAGYLINTFALSYVVNTLGVAPTVAMVSVVIGVGLSFFTVPLYGRLADRVGRRAVFIGGCIFLAAYMVPYFALLGTKVPVLIIIAMTVGYAGGQAALLGSQSAYLAELFPTKYRFSGIAFSREINVMLLGGTTPLIATALVAATGGTPTLVLVFVLAALIVSVVSLLFAPRQRMAPVSKSTSSGRCATPTAVGTVTYSPNEPSASNDFVTTPNTRSPTA